jgi:hypothetical protein
MKKSLFLPLVLLISVCSFGQDSFNSKKGYIGIGLGPTIYTGSTYQAGIIVPARPDGTIVQPPETTFLKSGSVGLSLNLLDAGYTLWRNWGLSLKWQGGSHVYLGDEEELEIFFGSILIGPMYSVKLNKNMSFDFKARVGRMYMGSKYESSFGGSVSKSTRDYFNVGVEAGSSLRYHIAPKWSWINTLEFQNHFTDYKEWRISRVNLTTGIGFRF